mgnify:CR=1 FL=1
MFNGIIYNQGTVSKIVKRPKGLNLFIKSNLKITKKDIGLSVACDGVCLTLISYELKIMEFYLSKETISRSRFKFLKINDRINLELPLKYGTKISGHICQGHVDTVGKILKIRKIDKSFLFDFEISKKERKNLIEKASICVNGISLTISKITQKGFQIWQLRYYFHPRKDTRSLIRLQNCLEHGRHHRVANHIHRRRDPSIGWPNRDP